MLTMRALSEVLLIGAEALDRYNPCAQHGAGSGEPCLDDAQRGVYCTARVPGDPMLARVLRAMAAESRRLG